MNTRYLSLQLFTAITVAFALSSGHLGAQTVTNASDNAGNYGSGWTNGANGGTGFGTWNITSFSSSNAFGGVFIGNPTDAGITTNAQFGSQAFAMYANPANSGAFVNVDRTFPFLQVGQTFSFQWAINFDSGNAGNKGFDLLGSGNQLLNVNQGGFPGDIVLNFGTNSVNTSNSITYGKGPMTWSFTRTTATNLLVTSTGRDGSGNIVFTTNIPITATPTSFRWYAAGMDGGNDRQPYFNNLQITGPAPVTNQVKFSVSMSNLVSQGSFNTNTGVVEVRGEFNNWSGNTLTNQGNNIYEGTLPVSGTTGTPLPYKFWATGLDFEAGGNRTVTIGTAGETQNLPTVDFDPVPIRNVTFSVDMSVLMANGGFDAATGIVQVRGPFNNFSGSPLTRQGTTGIYSGTVSVSGATGSSMEYIFWADSDPGTAPETPAWETTGNRSFTLGPIGQAQNLSTVYFSNVAGQRFVTFSVNMAIQQGKGAFNPGSGSVLIAGSFNNWNTNSNSIYALTNQGNNIYSGSFLLSASTTNSPQQYKYFAPGTTATGYESGSDRPFDLVFNTDGSNSPALVLATNYFSNELFYATPTSLSGFITSQGVVSTNQAVTVTGQGLTGNIVASAPIDWQISTNGTTYAPTVDLVPTDGAISGANLYIRIGAGAAPGSLSNSIALTSSGSASASVAVAGTVNSGQTFSNWAQGAPLNSANLLLYAIGGATNPTATNGTASTTTVTSSNLSITAIVRTNDQNLSVVGQAATDLSAVDGWSTNNVTMTPGDQAGVGEGLQKQIWSVPRASDTKKFLRLRTVLTNQ